MFSPAITAYAAGFIPAVLNPSEYYGEKALEYERADPVINFTFNEFAAYYLFALLFTIVAFNIVVMVISFRHAMLNRKRELWIIGIIPVYNLAVMSRSIKINETFILLYSLTHALQIVICLYFVFL